MSFNVTVPFGGQQSSSKAGEQQSLDLEAPSVEEASDHAKGVTEEGKRKVLAFVFKLGYEAYLKGIHITMNPYRRKEIRAGWEKGFMYGLEKAHFKAARYHIPIEERVWT